MADRIVAGQLGVLSATRGPDDMTDFVSDDDQLIEAYVLLLEHPELSITEFAARLGCGEDRVRSILDRLAAMSLLDRRKTEVGSMAAVSPVFALQQLMRQEWNLLGERQQFLQRSHRTLSQVLPSYMERYSSCSDVHVEQIDDLPAVRRRLEELAVSAKTEVLALRPAAANPTAARDASRSLDFDVLSRAVQLRALYSSAAVYDTDTLTYAMGMVDSGAMVRVASSLPLRMVIVDSSVAVVPVNPHDSREGCLVLHQRGVVAALVALFESLWRVSDPLSDSSRAGQDECTAGEQAVLRLLATGAKDDTVARQLGLSVRTVRRAIADLMNRLQASSRFELAVRAAARGWI